MSNRNKVLSFLGFLAILGVAFVFRPQSFPMATETPQNIEPVRHEVIKPRVWNDWKEFYPEPEPNPYRNSEPEYV